MAFFMKVKCEYLLLKNLCRNNFAICCKIAEIEAEKADFTTNKYNKHILAELSS